MLHYQTLKNHVHDFIKDLDGQVTCSICGAMDDEQEMK